MKNTIQTIGSRQFWRDAYPVVGELARDYFYQVVWPGLLTCLVAFVVFVFWPLAAALLWKWSPHVDLAAVGSEISQRLQWLGEYPSSMLWKTGALIAFMVLTLRFYIRREGK